MAGDEPWPPAKFPANGWPDWLDTFMAYTEGTPTSDLFRLWTGITTLAGATERRIWSEIGGDRVFPNLFVFLVASPGIGKSVAIKHAHRLWRDARKLHIAPDNVTKAALVDSVAAADTKRIVPWGLEEYHSLLVASSEFGVLLSKHDLDFLSTICHIYDNPPSYIESRRSLHKTIEIMHPQLTILAGAQPSFLASLFPEEAWTMGFTSRVIMVYSATSPRIKLFGKNASKEALKTVLNQGLAYVCELAGCMKWTEEAEQALQAWDDAGCPPAPEHSKLQNYVPRRTIHTVKLSMIAAISRTGCPLVHFEDFARARDWLLHVEHLMPDIFREMVHKSDSEVIYELHHYMWHLWAKEKKLIHERSLIYFLQNRVPVEKIQRIIDAAERSHMIEREPGTNLYRPKPRHEHGVE